MKKIAIVALLMLILTGCSTDFITPNIKGIKYQPKKVPKCGKLQLIKHKYNYEIPIKQVECIKRVLETTAYNCKICKKTNEANLKIIDEISRKD